MQTPWPAYAIAVFGMLFLLLAAGWPWLSSRFGAANAQPGQRLLSAVLGLALLGIFAIWLAATSD